MTSKTQQKAIVKNVISADSVVLRSAVSRPNQPPPERILALAYIEAPRFGSFKKPEGDEPYSLEARDFLRKLIVGKSVGFEVLYTTNSGREYGRLFTPESKDVAKILVENGWAKVSENARSRHSTPNPEDPNSVIVQELIEAQAISERKNSGIWSKKKSDLKRITTLDNEIISLLNQSKGKTLNATIEQVRDSTNFRVYLKHNKKWILVPVMLSGVKGPIVRVGIPGQEDLIEEFGIEAKIFVETRLIQRDVTITIESITDNNVIVGTVTHPAGNIAELLTANGFTRIIDWSAALVTGGAEKLRNAENVAKQKMLRIWKNYQPKAAKSSGSKFEAVVTRVVNANTIEVLDSTGKEREFQLSSVRPPKVSDPQLSGYADEAKEFLRKKLIGKKVIVKIDYKKPEQEGFPARDCATIKLENKNISVPLLERGLGYTIRHKRDDEDRSSEYDVLLAAEASGTEKKNGVHSGKVSQVAKYTDSSNNPARSKSLLPHFTRAGKLSATVDFVSQGSRFKLIVPRESSKINFVLAGIRCPRSGPGSPELYGAEAHRFSKLRIMQRDVMIEIKAADNTGAFIGNLYYNKTKNLAVDLLEAGLAQVHEYSVSQLSNANSYYAAENKAKTLKLGLWTNYVESAEDDDEESQKEATSNKNLSKPRAEFIDMVISEMTDSNNFFIQIAKPDVIANLETIMKELSISGKQPSGSLSKAPRVGELVSAKFPSDGIWYRGKVHKVVSPRECEVASLDYGNVEVISISDMKPLDPKLSSITPIAIQAKFAYLRSPVEGYEEDAFMYVRSLVEGKQLVANVEARSGSGTNQIMYLTLYDSDVKGAPVLEENSINCRILSEGFASVDKKDPASRRNPEGCAKLEQVVETAKSGRRGMWEYGDVLPEDDE
ncbi:hypothetical protein BB560_000181 [Smittium megazygosporum]|uniref:Uncharacterized protein n=1 Tax=Smittium megazygosporum TaxID=133381 RepID=A0A2T9ZL66_9FUNG|nr:hypothetical protein BB560_000181 [Smittium megazygosporum]